MATFLLAGDLIGIFEPVFLALGFFFFSSNSSSLSSLLITPSISSSESELSIYFLGLLLFLFSQSPEDLLALLSPTIQVSDFFDLFNFLTPMAISVSFSSPSLSSSRISSRSPLSSTSSPASSRTTVEAELGQWAGAASDQDDHIK